MRYSGWARVTFIGDTAAAEHLVPLARVVLGEVLNRLDIQADASFGRPVGSTRKTYYDGSVIEAGWDGTTPWMRITTGSESTSPTLRGYGFILSPFNGSEPPTGVTPLYQSSLLLINGDQYAHDYPDADHHWFTVVGNGNYETDLGNEWANNGLLQANLHWRSTTDTAYHVSWLGNSSDPIPYFSIGFQNQYATGVIAYQVRLSATTSTPPQSGQIFNFDTTQVFSLWLADCFGGLHNLQNGSGVGQVICYKGHVVKSVYDLLKSGTPVKVRNCIVGAGGSVDKDKNRTLYFVVRSFEQSLSTDPFLYSESVYSLLIDDITAVPVQIGSRDITTSGAYDSDISVDPIPMHGYVWNESAQTFDCIAVHATTKSSEDISNRPILQGHSLFATTGKATWHVTLATNSTPAIATFNFDTSRNIADSFTQTPLWNSTANFNPVTILAIDGTEYPTIADSVTDTTFKYSLNNALIGLTVSNEVTVNMDLSTIEHLEIHNNGAYSPTNGYQNQNEITEYTTTLNETLNCGNHSWIVAAFSLTAKETDSIAYDVTFSHVSGSLPSVLTLSYTGISFLWFNDVDGVFAYLEYTLQWTRTLSNGYGPIPITSSPPLPTESFALSSYQGRYTVESPEGTHSSDYFDLTAGGQIGNAPGHTNLFAFMPEFPIRITPGAGDDGNSVLISSSGTTEVRTRDYGAVLPLLELVNIVSMSLWDVPTWSVSAGFHTGVAGRNLQAAEPDGTYSFQPTVPGGWALNGKNLCFSQIGPITRDSLGNAVTTTPFDYLTNGDLPTLTGATGDDRGHYPLSYIAPREILAEGQT